MTEPAIIRIAAAIITNSDGQMLMVRKKGTDVFIQPGGKIEAGEDALTALSREIMEELFCSFNPESAHYIGHLSAPAANEADTTVEAEIFALPILGTPQKAAEIEELIWLTPQDAQELNIAPLSRTHIFPLLEPLAAEAISEEGLHYAE
jgi:8-oxo-dGTP diphosphatase